MLTARSAPTAPPLRRTGERVLWQGGAPFEPLRAVIALAQFPP